MLIDMKEMFILQMSFGVQVYTCVATGKEEVATNIFQNFIYKKVLLPLHFQERSYVPRVKKVHRMR